MQIEITIKKEDNIFNIFFDLTLYPLTSIVFFEKFISFNLLNEARTTKAEKENANNQGEIIKLIARQPDTILIMYNELK